MNQDSWQSPCHARCQMQEELMIFSKGAAMDRKPFARVVAMVAVIMACAAWTSTADPVSDWNTIAAQSTITAGQNAIVASRTLAIAQIAVHDALNAIDSRYERYAFRGAAPAGASVGAAVAAAARDALVGAIAVGQLPFVGFGNPTLQANAVAQVNAAYATTLSGIPG